MVDPSKGFEEAAGTPKEAPRDAFSRIRSESEADFQRFVAETRQELEAAKECIHDSPMLHRDKVFHLQGCDLLIEDLSTNPTQRDLLRAKHKVFDLTSLFKMIEESTTDLVTGLPNRKATLKEIERVISDLQRGEAMSAAILFIDLNKFKPINDELGHDQGDEALKLVGKALQDVVRKSDVVARIGGDEFVVLLHHNQPHHDFAIELAHIKEVLEKGIVFRGRNGKDYPIGGAIGFETIYPDDQPDTALKSADAKMFESKRGSRGMASEPAAPAGSDPAPS